MELREVRIPIHGLGCSGSGLAQVEAQARRLPGVVQVYGNQATESIYLIVDPTTVSAAQLQIAIARAGYTAGPTMGF